MNYDLIDFVMEWLEGIGVEGGIALVGLLIAFLGLPISSIFLAWKFTDSVRNDLKSDLTKLKDELGGQIKELRDETREIRETFVKHGFLEPFLKSKSKKEITKRGHELLDKYQVKAYLDANCPFLQPDKIKELNNETDLELFIKCLDWVKKHSSKKVLEITLNNAISESECNELVAVAIMEKIRGLYSVEKLKA